MNPQTCVSCGYTGRDVAPLWMQHWVGGRGYQWFRDPYCANERDCWERQGIVVERTAVPA